MTQSTDHQSVTPEEKPDDHLAGERNDSAVTDPDNVAEKTPVVETDENEDGEHLETKEEQTRRLLEESLEAAKENGDEDRVEELETFLEDFSS